MSNRKYGQPLSPPVSIVAASKDVSIVSLSSPSILKLASRLLVSHDEDISERSLPLRSRAVISASDDNGLTWRVTGCFAGRHGRLFLAGGKVYYIGNTGNLFIACSTDSGDNWSPAVALTENQYWHQSASNVWYAWGNIYLVMERITAGVPDTWQVPWIAPVLMRAKESADLTERSSWEFATELPFSEIIPGYKGNQVAIDFFGVPFFPQEYPIRHHLGDGRFMHPMGWLETNIVQIVDPRHYWYDPEGRTFHMLMRANTGGTGYAALAKVVEHRSGKMTTTLQCTPSGKRQLFLPFPGGHLRFHIIYDNASRLYWLLCNQATDSMTRPEKLSTLRYALPNNERSRLVIYFSTNVVDWCFAGLVDIGKVETECRCYASMVIDGDDLAIAARSGSGNLTNSRDLDLITFHRVERFRELVY